MMDRCGDSSSGIVVAWVLECSPFRFQLCIDYFGMMKRAMIAESGRTFRVSESGMSHDGYSYNSNERWTRSSCNMWKAV